MVRRPSPTPESRAKARRIAEALADMLIDDPLSFTEKPASSPATLSSAGTRRCPACGGEFEPVQRDAQLEINQCRDCGGIWLDRGELDQLLAPSIEAAPKTAPDRHALRSAVAPAQAAAQTIEYRGCPVCATTMKRENFAKTSGVMIDRCPTHGVFLDRGELEAIVAWIRTGGLAYTEELERSQDSEAERRDHWRERESKHDRDRALREKIRARMRRALF